MISNKAIPKYVTEMCQIMKLGQSAELPKLSVTSHTVSTHTVSTHTVSTHTVSAHTVSTHTGSTHTVSTHTVSTHTVSTHTVSTHAVSVQRQSLRASKYVHSVSVCSNDSEGIKKKLDMLNNLWAIVSQNYNVYVL